MNLLILDPSGLALDLAVLAQSQGHDVTHFIKDTPSTCRIGENVVTRVRGGLESHVKCSDVIFVADTCSHMFTFDKLREISKKESVWIGPTEEQAKWEMDRKLGQDLLAKYDIPVAPYKVFSDYDAAIEYVRKRDTRLVSKPFGTDQDDKSLSYVSKGPEDLIYMLERWKKSGKLKNQFMLQDFVAGVEFGAEGWFNGEEWSGPFHESFEHKKLMAGDVGPATGEMGTVNLAVSKSNLADKVLAPLTPLLKASHYIGFFNINCIVDNKGKPWPLEITARPGWPCFQLQLSINKGDIVENLYRDKAPKFRTGVTTTGVILAIPDFPFSHITRKEVLNIPVFGFDEENGHFHPCEMMKNREDKWVTAGDYVACITGHGKSICESADQAYKNLKSLVLPNSPMYRTDIGYKLEGDLKKLHSYGLAKHIQY